jgi:hypothetical protein
LEYVEEEVMEEEKGYSEEKPIDGCPAATQDITINLEHRQEAIDKAHYGPMIPSSPNNGFWSAKAKLFGVPIAEAKKARCKNCAAFIQTPEMLGCIAKGLGNEPFEASQATIKNANLGYCSIFDFKCAGDRTCDAWVANGPITKG